MKKFFKMLAVVLALTLVIGTIPVSAATEVTLKKSTKTLYLGGCIGAKSTGKKAPYYSYAKLSKLLSNFDSDTMKVRATSDNTAVVKTSTTRITSVGTGTANVTLKVYKGTVKAKNLIKTFTVKVTVKKNASASDLTYKGITDGATYKVGESITVTLPKGTDTDKRGLDCSSADVTIKSAGTNKWKVTFNKAGSYKLTAKAYQSSTYKKATQSKTINVTVKAEEAKEAKLTAKQTTLKAFTIETVAKDLDKDDIKFYTLVASSEMSKKNQINTFTVKDGVATVTLFSNLESGTTYYVEIDGVKTSFTAAGGKLADVKTVKITTQKAKVGIPTDITYSLFTAEGIDITDGVKGEITGSNLKFTLIDSNGKDTDFTDVATVIGNQITFSAADKVATVKAILTTGYNTTTYEPYTCEGVGNVLSFEDTVSGDILYTFTKDDGVYMTEKDTRSTWFTVDDTVCVEGLFPYTDGSYKTFAQMGITRIDVADELIVMVQGNALSGGYKLHANNPGTTTLLLYAGDTYKGKIPVEVKAARKAARFVVKAPENLHLNTNAIVGDYLYFTAKAYDQYNEEFPDAHFEAVQSAASIASTGTVSGLTFGGLHNDVLIINGTDVLLNANPAGGVIISITCKEIANCVPQNFNILVKDVPPTASTVPYVTVEGDAVIDTTLVPGAQDFEPTYISVENRADGFLVSEDVGKCFTTKPTNKLTSIDLGVPDGYIVIGFAIELDGKVINPDDYDCISYSPSAIEFTPVMTGKKLPKGSYAITVYKITAGATYSVVSIIDAKKLTVIDGEPEIACVQKADNIATTLPAGLTQFFSFYCDGTDITSSFASAEYQESSNKTAYIKTVTLNLTNSVYGPFQATVLVDKLISLK